MIKTARAHIPVWITSLQVFERDPVENVPENGKQHNVGDNDGDDERARILLAWDGTDVLNLELRWTSCHVSRAEYCIGNHCVVTGRSVDCARQVLHGVLVGKCVFVVKIEIPHDCRVIRLCERIKKSRHILWLALRQGKRGIC